MTAPQDAALAEDVPAESLSEAAAGGDLDSISLGDTPGHLLRRAQQRAVEIYQRAVGDAGLRPPQFALLLTIHHNAGMTQTELVQETGIDRSTLADMTGRLEQRGLLLRRPGTDQRSRRLWLTAEGEAVLRESAAAATRAQEEIMAPIPAADRVRFLGLLRRIADLPEPGPDSKSGA